jgi:siroheme synthase (precorrin-2 oxidase/ferrochelatase)
MITRTRRVIAAATIIGATIIGGATTATADPAHHHHTATYCHEAAHDTAWLTYVATHDGGEQSRVMWTCDRRRAADPTTCHEDEVCALWQITTTGRFVPDAR